MTNAQGVVLQGRLPDESAWTDIDQTTYDHACANGLEVRKLHLAPADTAASYRNEGFDVICDRRDLFDVIRAAWRDGQDHGGELSEAERWSKASDYATAAIRGWATLHHVPQAAEAGSATR